MSAPNDERVPSTAGLLAVTAYAGADHARQLIGLINLIRELHGPQEGNTARPAVCTTCRDSRGRKVVFPCPEFVRSSEIVGFKLDPSGWAELGITLPASLCKPRAIEEGRQA